MEDVWVFFKIKYKIQFFLNIIVEIINMQSNSEHRCTGECQVLNDCDWGCECQNEVCQISTRFRDKSQRQLTDNARTIRLNRREMSG